MVGTSNQSVPEMTIEDIPMVAESFSMTSDVLWRKKRDSLWPWEVRVGTCLEVPVDAAAASNSCAQGPSRT